MKPRSEHTIPRVIPYPGVISDISGVWDEVLHLGGLKKYTKGQMFSFEGETAYDFFYLKTGTVYAVFSNSNGLFRTNLLFQNRSLINETAAIARYNKEIMRFCCDTPVEGYVFKGSLLQDSYFQRTYPHLIQNVLTSMATKIMNFQTILNSVCTLSKIQLICWYLLAMSKSHNNALSFNPQFSQADVAALLGVHLSSMKRTIALLKEQGILDHFTKTSLCILDRERLQALAVPVL